MDDVYVEDITTIGAQVTIEFTIPLSWATENYIDLSTVKLMRYCDGWGELTTTFLGTDDKAPYAAYYEAVVPGFSTFAVIGSEIVEITEVTAFSWIIIGGVIASITTILVAVLFKARYIYLEGEHPMEHPKKKLSRKNKLKVEKYQISQKH